MPSSIAARPEGRGTKNRGSLHDRPKVVEFRARASYSRAIISSASACDPASSCTKRKSCVTLAARLTGTTAAETISVMLVAFA